MKKGFTLVEMITVLSLLAILALLITPIIGREMKESTDKLYQKQIQAIEQATDNYVTDHIENMPEQEGEIYKITLKDLKDGGYIDKKLQNPKTKKEFQDTIEISITRTQNQYQYTITGISVK